MKLSHVSLLASLLFSASSWALSSDTEQPIHINSNSQNFDMQSNQVTFTGNVTLKQGSIEIFADKIVVIRPQGKEGREVLEAYGKPTRFSQLTDDGKTLKGKANKLRYELENEFLKMTDSAELTQDDSIIKGKVITYNMKTQKLIADGGKDDRVTTILQPSQLNNK
ncbi:lipopolysaccharide transport periplasmic protein LptA [Aliivibrio fischeri]|uniref:Lipopolysaccharide export system protein LptA n=1 Tax=Aliivibrio fischeri (strain ATCC 700601 / ES114) TaxID=312309 RepID=Q5E7W2_ALIF1|nr:lipopolysaccharide transport periplasmic protein LptA [Aliivibrio fischeri]AAW84884.1 predicted transporter subunit: periplasmic-binding component of ABC superfamily [Aliivibrio fischeri ES114]KLU77450.1 ABC transporter substrate-binding protein [Aliivibrio fischeri]MCE7537383.1 lipopolysaccharide transport periplasmic protein LptA [Aliivibrio fischeri]MCE7560315.1 lipopolysaccharide transport periplasmic protein LptA [Aliivibrio fischeri]MCE7567767.1 lipopolysaccharide transport periplasmi